MATTDTTPAGAQPAAGSTAAAAQPAGAQPAAGSTAAAAQPAAGTTAAADDPDAAPSPGPPEGATALVPGLWQRPALLGYQETLRGLGGIVAPLLTGFSLTTVAALVTASSAPPLAGWAILAFSGATAALLYSMQVAFLALQRDPSPAQALQWYPEAAVNKRTLDYVREQQGRDFRLMQHYERRHFITYELGILLFLAGVALLVWPDSRHASFERWAALAIVGAAMIVEGWWSIARVANLRIDKRNADKPEAQRRKRWPHPAIREPVARVVASPLLPTESAAALDPGRRDAAKLDFPDLAAEPNSSGM